MEKTTKQKADELVEQFLQLVDCGDNRHTTRTQIKNATKCAIFCQEREVNTLTELKEGEHSDSFWIIENEILKAQELLTELKSRL